MADDPDKPVSLVTGRQLVDTMVEFGLGVRQRPVVEFEVEEEFFAG